MPKLKHTELVCRQPPAIPGCKRCAQLGYACHLHRTPAVKKKKGPAGLEPKHRRFVSEYLVDYDAARAAVVAGFSPSSAYYLLQTAAISREIEQRIRAQDRRLGALSDRVLTEMCRIAMVDPGEMFDEKGNLRPIREIPPHVRAAITKIEVKEVFDPSQGLPTRVTNIHLGDKNTALAHLAKVIGMVGGIENLHLHLHDEEQTAVEVDLDALPVELKIAIVEALEARAAAKAGEDNTDAIVISRKAES